MSNMDDRKVDILSRLRKVEGQVKGIQRMIEEEKCCGDIMIQISAVRSAINKIGGLVLDGYIKDCIPESIKKEEHFDEKLNEIIETIVKYVK